MRNFSYIQAVAGAAALFGVGLGDARAQVYGTDYLAFQGTAVVLDNPTSAACQANNINFNKTYTIVYRFSANPAVTSDAMSFIIGNDSVHRIFPTAPATSLAGGAPVAVTWTHINRFSNFSGGILPGNSTMTILAGNNTAVGLGTGNIKIVNGTIDNFFSTAGCTVQNLHGAAVAIPQ